MKHLPLFFVLSPGKGRQQAEARHKIAANVIQGEQHAAGDPERRDARHQRPVFFRSPGEQFSVRQCGDHSGEHRGGIVADGGEEIQPEHGQHTAGVAAARAIETGDPEKIAGMEQAGQGGDLFTQEKGQNTRGRRKKTQKNTFLFLHGHTPFCGRRPFFFFDFSRKRCFLQRKTSKV